MLQNCRFEVPEGFVFHDFCNLNIKAAGLGCNLSWQSEGDGEGGGAGGEDPEGSGCSVYNRDSQHLIDSVRMLQFYVLLNTICPFPHLIRQAIVDELLSAAPAAKRISSKP